MNLTPKEEIAWAAGLFEGEGTWIVRQSPRSPFKTAVIALQMCDRAVVEHFARVMGCGSVTCERRSERNAAHSDIWRWTTAKREDCKRIAEMLLPYLEERRAAKAREIIEATSRPDGRARGISRRWPQP